MIRLGIVDNHNWVLLIFNRRENYSLTATFLIVDRNYLVDN